MNRATFTALTGAIAGVLATKSLAAEPDISKTVAPAAPSAQRIAMLVYPGMTVLDLIAPQLIFAALPNTDVQLVWKDRQTVVSDTGVPLVPTQAFDDVTPGLTVLFSPGGSKSYDLMNDPDVMKFLQRVGPTAQYVTSVCTGSLVLASAGLFRGYRATTHWVVHDVLATLGAIPVSARVVVDRNRITGAGVTAGIDFGLTMAARIAGDDYARMLQLMFEYDPQPPFNAGSEKKAGKKIDERARAVFAQLVISTHRQAAIAHQRLVRDMTA